MVNRFWLPKLLCLLVGVGSAWAQAPTATRPAAAGTPDPALEDTLRQAVRALNDADDAIDPAAAQAALDEAQRLTERIRSSAPENDWLLYLQGRLLAAAGRRSEAADNLNRFVETRAGRSEWSAYRALGDLYVEGFATLAQSRYRQAATLKPNEPTVLHGLARCALKLGDYAGAVKHAEAAVQASGSRDVRYMAFLTEAYLRSGSIQQAYNQAAATVERAWQDVRNFPGVRARVQLLDSQFQLVQEILGRQIEETPRNPEFYRLAGHWLRERAKIAQMLGLCDALLMLELGIQQSGQKPTADLLAEYAVVLAELGRTDDAAKAYAQIYSIDPNHPALRSVPDGITPAPEDAPPAEPTPPPSAVEPSPPPADEPHE
ncbi:MAG TPA: hypothetical protein PKK06_07600 [Phycisphaerae bacterium]|nr:hypothetical protein [Phycisphaerae bacterium]HNU46621.1 hypothetical protein [Phycisphaerae bacterium]